MMNAQTALAARSWIGQRRNLGKQGYGFEAMRRTTTTRQYEFREVTDPAELEQVFRLRYRVFRACDLRHLVRENDCKIDVDAYDLRAHHYGLFHRTSKGCAVVGCVRVVTDHETSAAPLIRKIVQIYGDLERVISEPTREIFPIVEISPYGAEILSIYRETKAKGRDVVEAGRLALDPSHQYLKLGAAVVQAAAAVGFIIGEYGHAFVWSCHHAARFFRIGGFKKLPGTAPFRLGKLREPLVCQVGTVGDIPASSRLTIEGYAEEIRSTGRIRIEVETKQAVDESVSPAGEAAHRSGGEGAHRDDEDGAGKEPGAAAGNRVAKSEE